MLLEVRGSGGFDVVASGLDSGVGSGMLGLKLDTLGVHCYWGCHLDLLYPFK